MAPGDREELVLEVEWEIIDASNGVSFDMGGSVMKVAMVDKRDYIEPQKRQKGSKGKIRLVNFSRAELDQAFTSIKDRAHIPRNSDKGKTSSVPSGDELPIIYTTGFGGTEYAKRVEEVLNVKNVNLMEMDCFEHALKYLMKNLPRNELVFAPYKPAFEDVKKLSAAWMTSLSEQEGKSVMMDEMLNNAKDTSMDYEEQLKDSDSNKAFLGDENLYPFGVVMCGSAFGLSYIDKGGATQSQTMSARGGKFFLGLGSLLCGAKTFEELMTLCEKGNAFSVSQSSKHIFSNIDSGGTDIYSGWADAMRDKTLREDCVFSFGQALGKSLSDFKKEDLARALLESCISDIVNVTMQMALGRGMRHVFFCGGFVNHKLTRELMMFYWLLECLNAKFGDLWKGDIQLHFLVHGQSLGAIGALLNHKLQWSEKNAKEKEQSATQAEK